MDFYIQRGENMLTKSVPLQSTEMYSICFKILNLNSFFKILNLLTGTNFMSPLMSHCYLFFQTNAMIPVFIQCISKFLFKMCTWVTFNVLRIEESGFWLLDAPLFPPACTFYTKNKSHVSKILNLWSFPVSMAEPENKTQYLIE